jgi:MFS transporter, DHA1 family, multidrug resistance protein
MGVLLACVFVVMSGYGKTLTVLPFYTQRIHGLQGDQATISLHIGVLTSVYALAQLGASPIAGRLADRVGRRPVLVGGLAGLALSQVIFGFVSELWVLYALRVVGGAAGAAMIVAATAYVADISDESDRTAAMAHFGAAVSFGVVAGPALGGVLGGADATGTSSAGGLGFALPFVVAGVLTIVVAAAAATLLPKPARLLRSRGPVPGPKRSTRSRGHGLRALLGLVVASQFGLALFEGTFVLYARDRIGLSAAQAGTAFVVCGLSMGVFQLFAVGPLTRVVSPPTQIAVGVALAGIGIAGLVTSRNFGVLLGWIAVLALGSALTTPNLAALIATRAGPATGQAIGLKSAASSVGQFAGPMTGVVLLGLNPAAPFVGGGVALVAIGAGYAIATRANRPPRAPDRRKSMS